MWLYSSLWILKRCILGRREFQRFTESQRKSSGVGTQCWAQSSTPKSDSMWPRERITARSWRKQWTKSCPEDQKVEVFGVWRHRQGSPCASCYLCVIKLPACNYLAEKCEEKLFSTNVFYGRKGKWWFVTEGNQMCRPLETFLGCTKGHFIGILILFSLGSKHLSLTIHSDSHLFYSFNPFWKLHCSQEVISERYGGEHLHLLLSRKKGRCKIGGLSICHAHIEVTRDSLPRFWGLKSDSLRYLSPEFPWVSFYPGEVTPKCGTLAFPPFSTGFKHILRRLLQEVRVLLYSQLLTFCNYKSPVGFTRSNNTNPKRKWMSKAAIASGSISTHLGWIVKRQLCVHKALWDVTPCTQWSSSLAKMVFFLLDLMWERKKEAAKYSLLPLTFLGLLVGMARWASHTSCIPWRSCKLQGEPQSCYLTAKKVFRGKIVSSHSHFACDFSYICF